MIDKNTNILVKDLGGRLKQTRVNANLTQSQLADLIGKSRTAIERAEKGKCNLGTFVSILVALDADSQLNLFLPDMPPSPVLLAKAKGKQRKRATGKRAVTNDEDNLGW